MFSLFSTSPGGHYLLIPKRKYILSFNVDAFIKLKNGHRFEMYYKYCVVL